MASTGGGGHWGGDALWEAVGGGEQGRQTGEGGVERGRRTGGGRRWVAAPCKGGRVGGALQEVARETKDKEREGK